ncbi:hypothetical protein D3C84_1297730 [compost metagenome]
MLPKAKGRLTNINPGPSLGFRPAANTIGNNATPANSDTKVSNSATPTTVRVRDAFLGM